VLSFITDQCEKSQTSATFGRRLRHRTAKVVQCCGRCDGMTDGQTTERQILQSTGFTRISNIKYPPKLPSIYRGKSNALRSNFGWTVSKFQKLHGTSASHTKRRFHRSTNLIWNNSYVDKCLDNNAPKAPRHSCKELFVSTACFFYQIWAEITMIQQLLPSSCTPYYVHHDTSKSPLKGQDTLPSTEAVRTS
jgi:hypothetical protein